MSQFRISNAALSYETELIAIQAGLDTMKAVIVVGLLGGKILSKLRRHG